MHYSSFTSILNIYLRQLLIKSLATSILPAVYGVIMKQITSYWHSVETICKIFIYLNKIPSKVNRLFWQQIAEITFILSSDKRAAGEVLWYRPRATWSCNCVGVRFTLVAIDGANWPCWCWLLKHKRGCVKKVTK